MRVAIDTVLIHFDELTLSQVETEVRVTAEVVDPANSDSKPESYIALLSISEPEHEWSPGEISELKKDDLNAIREALWDAYLLTDNAEEVAELLQTHVRLALETGTDAERIRSLLANVKSAVLASGRAA